MITINSSTRQFNIPGADLVFGVTADAGAVTKQFQCPRYVGDNLDLTGCFIRINYRNANGEIDFKLIENVTVDGDNVVFGWELSPKVTMYKGNVSFVMCVVGPDNKLKWHTTLGRGQVLEGLEPDNEWIESVTGDGVAELIAMVEAQTKVVEDKGAEWVRNVQGEGTDQIIAVQTAAQEAQSDAVAEIEAKGVSTLATIPENYTTVQKAVRGAANAIRGKVSGSVIRVDDVSSMEHYPVVSVHGKNLFNYPVWRNVEVNNGSAVFTDDCSVTITASADDCYTVYNEAKFPELARVKVTPGERITLSWDVDNTTVSGSVYIFPNGTTSDFGQAWSAQKVLIYTVPRGCDYITFRLGVARAGDTITFSHIQIERGAVATEYEPYIDPTTAALRLYGKNLCPTLDVGKTGSTGGVTFTGLKGGGIGVSGTPTSLGRYSLYNGEALTKNGYIALSLTGNFSNIIWDFQLRDTNRVIVKQIQTGTSATLNLDSYPKAVYWDIGIKRYEDGVACAGTVYVQVEVGMTASEFEAYQPPMKYTPSVDGTISGLTALSPTMTLLTNTAGVNIECEYSRDTNKVIAEILEKITALGG